MNKRINCTKENHLAVDLCMHLYLRHVLFIEASGQCAFLCWKTLVVMQLVERDIRRDASIKITGLGFARFVLGYTHYLIHPPNNIMM